MEVVSVLAYSLDYTQLADRKTIERPGNLMPMGYFIYAVIGN